VHVPLIISCPGVIQPQRRNELVELVDLPQTVLDILGLPHHAGMQGRSVWPLLSGNADEYRTREDVYCEYYFSMPFFSDPPAQMTMVRTERYKLTVDHNASFGELYDLQDDPDERYNHWDDPAYTAVKTMMLVRLCNRMAWTADPLPARKAMW